MGATETVRENRKDMSQELKDKQLRKGETAVMSNDPLSFLSFNGRKKVYLLSTTETNEMRISAKKDKQPGLYNISKHEKEKKKKKKKKKKKTHTHTHTQNKYRYFQNKDKNLGIQHSQTSYPDEPITAHYRFLKNAY